ncbi:asparaginyl-tRNA synthetase [Lentinula raphanica]|nr:asparaginyl-tRNA synthetase [Lentinula raphanica]
MGLGRGTLVRLRTGCSPRCLPSPSPQLNVLLHRRPARGSPSLYLCLSRPTRDHERGYATAPRSQALQRSFARPHKLPRLRGLPRTIEEVLEEGLDSSPSSKTITLIGHVHSIRRQKRSTFLSLSDGSSDRTIQVVLRHAPQLQKEVRDTLKEISFGSAIQITGILVQSQGPGQDIDVLLDLHSQMDIQILGTCDSTTYPLQPKNSTRLPSSSPTTQGHSLSHLRSHLHLRLRTPSLQHTLRLRALTKHILESYLSSPSRRFLSVHTPILTGIDAEGGGESFVVCAGDQGEGESFFNAPAYLTVSSQLHLEAFQASLGRVYTLSPCFRAERSLTARHLSEFWMLECEWALGGGGVEDLCEFVEDMVRYTIKEVVFPEHVGGESELYHTAFDPLPWPRITYTSAIKILQDQSLQHSLSQPQPLFQHPPTWGLPLQSEHEKYLTDVYFPPLQNQHRRLPVFVVDYPRSVKPFYMRVNDVEGIERANEAQTVACFDLLVPGVGELAGGSVREERYEILKQSMERAGLLSPSPSPSPPSSLSQSQSQSQPPNDTSSSSSSSSSDKIPSPYEWYLDLRKYGSIPHGGFGLGFERLIAWLVAGTEASGPSGTSVSGAGAGTGSEENGGNVGEVGEVGNIREMIGMPRWKGRMAL